MTPLWHPNLAKLTLWPQEPPVTCWPWQLQREGVPAWQAPEPWALVGHWKPPGWRQHHDQFTCILTGGPPEVEHGMWELWSAVRGYDCTHRGVSLTWGTAGSAMKSTVLQPCCCSEGQESQSALLTTPSHRTSLFIPSPMLQIPALKSGAAPVHQALTTTLLSCLELRHPQPGCSGTELLVFYWHSWHLTPDACKTNTYHWNETGQREQPNNTAHFILQKTQLKLQITKMAQKS